jgi:hypothetical protein
MEMIYDTAAVALVSLMLGLLACLALWLLVHAIAVFVLIVELCKEFFTKPKRSKY